MKEVPKKEDLIGSYKEIQKMYLAKNKKQKMSFIIKLFTPQHVISYRIRKALRHMQINVIRKNKKKALEKLVILYFRSKSMRLMQCMKLHCSKTSLNISDNSSKKLSDELSRYYKLRSCIIIQRWYRKWKFGKWLRKHNSLPSYDGNKITLVESQSVCITI